MNKDNRFTEEINNAIAVLKNGGTLLYPTDTIWGIGCDALNSQAIEKVYEIKKRPAEKNFIIIIPEENLLMKYVKEVPEPVWDLIQYSERPLTIIYQGAINLPSNLISKDGSIAIRVVKNGFAYELLRKYNKPLVSTSANYSGEKTALHFKEIDKGILGSVDYVVALSAESTVSAIPSVIMQIETNGRFKFIRN